MEKINIKQKTINLNTFPKLNILIKFSYLKDYEGTLSEFEKKINSAKGNPETREVFKVLREKGVLYPTTKKYSFQLYKLDIKSLCKVIEQQEFIKKINKYSDYMH